MTTIGIECDEVTLHRSDAHGVVGEELARQPAPESGDATFSVPHGIRQFVCIVSWLRGERLLVSDHFEFSEVGGKISYGPFPLAVTTDERLVNDIRVTTAEGAISELTPAKPTFWDWLGRLISPG
ncbi:MAG TPA: hypothetical protein VFE65_16390 [Pseudonocardia sp.]|jgi:hypothetical protein|nr:hypothetical protein [Pseudonocardia sp.]